MADPRYAELHAHSNFSFLDGASHPERLVERATELGYEALAVTDHDGFYGLVRFWQAAREAGLPSVYGVELSLRPAGSPDEGESVLSPFEEAARHDAARISAPADEPTRGKGRRARRNRRTKPAVDHAEAEHLVVLAPSPEGYAQLSRLVSRAQLRGEKDRPLYRWEDPGGGGRPGRTGGSQRVRTGSGPASSPTERRGRGPPGGVPPAGDLRAAFPHRALGPPDAGGRPTATICCGRQRTGWSCPWWPPTTSTTPIAGTPTCRRCWRRSGGAVRSRSTTGSGPRRTSAT